MSQRKRAPKKRETIAERDARYARVEFTSLVDHATRNVTTWAEMEKPFDHICLWPPCPRDTVSGAFHFCAEHELTMRANGYEPPKESPEGAGNKG